MAPAVFFSSSTGTPIFGQIEAGFIINAFLEWVFGILIPLEQLSDFYLWASARLPSIPEGIEGSTSGSEDNNENNKGWFARLAAKARKVFSCCFNFKK